MVLVVIIELQSDLFGELPGCVDRGSPVRSIQVTDQVPLSRAKRNRSDRNSIMRLTAADSVSQLAHTLDDRREFFIEWIDWMGHHRRSPYLNPFADLKLRPEQQFRRNS